jgi:hypothetical protein
VASVALLLAVGAWTLFRDPQRAPIDAGSLARPATAVKKVVTPATAVRSVPPPVAVPAKAPESAARVPAGAAAGPEPKTEEPVASPAKSARSRESAKKRKDPWLE